MARLNQHTDKLACQTCHIPEYARDEIGTELSWDWSQATIMGPDGKPTSRKDSAGRRAFDSKKGAWVWDSYVIPEYRWFNGVSTYKVIGDKIDPSKTVQINEVGGSPNDPDSRIWPTKVHRGKQPYDKVNNYPHRATYRRRRRHRPVAQLRLAESDRCRDEGRRFEIQRRVRFRQHRDDLADHPHGRAEDRRLVLRPVPQQERTPEGYRGRVYAFPRQQQTGSIWQAGRWFCCR